ncbi:DegV family protein [Butyrivibrio sp. XPD2002]|uniref:DegV family protein n=1 Tax=Butyrivibrio sp. XPD2002 TaxID=1280665 RepID=UPI0004277EE5|nr:DegV family protein [Butyrivibrio sp. XPD2002]
MIRRLLRKIIAMIKDPSRDFRERIFILLTLVISPVIILALAGDIYFGENIIEIGALIFSVIMVPIMTFISVKRDKVNQVAKIVVLGLVFVLLPILFFCGGGIEGGGILWVIFAYLYIGLVLSGKWKPVILVILTVEVVLFYAMGYFYPETVYQHTHKMFYVDSMLSIIMVGVIITLTVWFEEGLYKEENKRAKEENKKIEELINNQNSFFSSMSHEIRTPINTILGLNEIILRQEDASDEILKDSQHIQGAGRMLLTLVNDILDISKMEAGEMDIVPVNYNMENMVSDIVNIMWLRAEEKGLEFNVEVDPTIPVELFGDETRIKQILINLLNNAVKYTDEGAVTLHIEKGEINGDYVLLLFSIIDTGIGIKQDAIPYLFDAFRRVDEERNAGIEGTGLGLAIVKRLVDLMNGKITVSSVYTEGSTFIVTLRQKVARHDSIGEIDIRNFGFKRPDKKYMPSFTAPDARILIVDDNEMNLEVERKLIADTMMTIDTVTSGDEALSMTLSEKYDIIFLDHLMPDMDGIECLQYIRKQAGGLNNQVPAIALTANAGSDVRELYNKSGFDGYLLKPISGNQLEEMLLEHLPELKVKRTVTDNNTKVRMNSTRGYSKKISVIVATSSMCDLPQSTLRNCQIDIIPFNIIADGKTYSDRIEASTDEVINYMKQGVSFESMPPSVEDFERFFGKEIKKAHEVIYLSLPPAISKEYENALEAAKEYGNVKVFDSGYNSGAMGMLTLIAYKLSMQGASTERILEELEEAKQRTRCSFITGDAELLMKRGSIGKWIYGFISTFGFRPSINVKNGSIYIGRMYVGDYLKCYEEYIENTLPKRIRPDLDVIIVEYIELTEEGRTRIKEAIRKRFSFEHILMQKVSAVVSLNCGMGAVGLSFMMKGDNSYELSKLLCEDEAEDNEEAENLVQYAIEENESSETEEENDESKDAEDTEETTTIEAKSSDNKKWYEKLPGIDSAIALDYSGSEEALLSIIEIFYESIDKKADEIEALYNSGDYKNYTIKVHALKSSARLIGATELGEHAEALEMAGKANNLEFIKENTAKTLDELRNYKKVFGPLFNNENEKGEETVENDEKENTPGVNEKFDSNLLVSVYEGILEGADNCDENMIAEILDEIADYDLPDEDMEILKKVKEHLDKKEFNEIRNLIDN